MKVLNTPPETVCDPYMNIYDCYGSDMLFYGTIVCLAITVSINIYGGYVSIIRWRNDMPIKLVHRVDGCWLPTYIDSVLLAAYLCNTYRIFFYICVLVDWPRNWISRSVLTGTLLYTMFLPLLVLLTGIISYIPSIFIRRSIFKHDNYLSTSKATYTLYAPTANQLFWMSAILATLHYIILISISICLGWIRHRGITKWDDPVHRVLGSYFVFGHVIMLFLNTEEINAGHRFRRIFITFALGSIASVVLGALVTAFLLSLWPSIIFFVGGNGVVYQTILLVLFYTQSQNTKAYLRRSTIPEQVTSAAWHTMITNAYLEPSKSIVEYNPSCVSLREQSQGFISARPRVFNIKPRYFVRPNMAKTNEIASCYGLQSTRMGFDGIGGGDDYMGTNWKGHNKSNEELCASIEAMQSPPPEYHFIQSQLEIKSISTQSNKPDGSFCITPSKWQYQSLIKPPDSIIIELQSTNQETL
ncbi:hypothetical protein BDF19DRAFT_429631 [Syncephalis fuscata]|nr:hypothetical protein BDF19DRAFT_429631 [Syncephalis fuscata]